MIGVPARVGVLLGAVVSVGAGVAEEVGDGVMVGVAVGVRVRVAEGGAGAVGGGGFFWVPWAISSPPGGVGAKLPLRKPNAHPKAERQILPPYALPGIMM